jgi:hypothetical protein
MQDARMLPLALTFRLEPAGIRAVPANPFLV